MVDETSPEPTLGHEHTTIPPNRHFEQPVDQVAPHDLPYQHRNLEVNFPSEHTETISTTPWRDVPGN